MLNSKYNKFILSVLIDDIAILFDTIKDTLEYPVPFGNYKVGDYISEEGWNYFQEQYDKYVLKHSLKLIDSDLIECDVADTSMHDIIFSYDNNYYKVPIGYSKSNFYMGWDTNPEWLTENLEKYKVVPKTVTTTIYEYV